MDDHELADLLHAWREPRISTVGIGRIRRDTCATPPRQLRQLSPWIAAAMAAGVALGFAVPANDHAPVLVRHDLSTLVSWVW